jgi:hypothetical protein
MLLVKAKVRNNAADEFLERLVERLNERGDG